MVNCNLATNAQTLTFILRGNRVSRFVLSIPSFLSGLHRSSRRFARSWMKKKAARRKKTKATTRGEREIRTEERRGHWQRMKGETFSLRSRRDVASSRVFLVRFVKDKKERNKWEKDKTKKKRRRTRWETTGTMSILSLSPFEKLVAKRRKKEKKKEKKRKKRMMQEKQSTNRRWCFSISIPSGFCLTGEPREEREGKKEASDHLAIYFSRKFIIEKEEEEEREKTKGAAILKLKVRCSESGQKGTFLFLFFFFFFFCLFVRSLLFVS